MGRPKGTQNKNVTPIAKAERIKTDNESTEDKCVFLDPKEESIKYILLLIVDALYDKDGDSATWKPIRDKIEAL